MEFESYHPPDMFRLPVPHARSRAFRLIAAFNARSAAVLLSTSCILPLPLIAAIWPDVLHPNAMGWLAAVWVVSAAILTYTVFRGRLSEREFCLLGSIGILAQALTSLLIAHSGPAMAVLALLVVIPTLAAISRSIPMLLWMVALSLGSAITVTTLRSDNVPDLIVGIGVFSGSIVIPVLIVARLRVALYQQVEYQTALNGIDPLTGLLNRRGLFRRASQILLGGGDPHRILGVLLMDIDHFKRVNDEHGHATGDTALREVAAQIADSVPPEALVCRYGGEEFLVLLGFDEAQQVTALAESIRSSIETRTALTLSIGVAFTPEPTVSGRDPAALQGLLEYLIQQADRCVYHAKKHGRNRAHLCCVDLPNPLPERTPPEPRRPESGPRLPATDQITGRRRAS